MTSTTHSFFRLGLIALVLFAGVVLFANSAAALGINPPNPCTGGGGGGGGGGSEAGGDCEGGSISATLDATPQIIDQGHSSNLTYVAWGAQSCSISNGVGSVPSGSGTRTVSPNTTTTYVLSCVFPNPNGTGGTVTLTDDATVTVRSAPPPSITASCSAAPTIAEPSQSVTWSGYAQSGSGSGYRWVYKDTSRTKICSGGSNTSNIQNNCPEDLGSCSASQAGQTCRAADIDCESHGTADDGIPNVYYGNVNRYRCEPSSSSAATFTYSWSGTNSLSGSTQNVTKSYTSTGTKSGTFTASTGGGSASATCQMTVEAAAVAQQPNLRAGTITPTIATAGSATTFSSTISNNGNASSGAGFYTLFQRATSSGGANATDIGTHQRTTALAASGSFTATRSYTFPSAGTYYVRACTDKSSSTNNGAITESSESDNCGAWTAVTVSTASSLPPAPTNLSHSCNVNNTQVTLSWNASSGATGYYVRLNSTSNDTASCTDGWLCTTPPDRLSDNYSGTSITYGITANQNYEWWVHGANSSGVGNPSTGSFRCPAAVVSCGAETLSISASPDRVREGESTTISWNASGVDTSCTISGPGLNQSIPGASCVIPNGSANVTINSQSVYTITCDGSGASEDVVVNLIPGFIEF